MAVTDAQYRQYADDRGLSEAEARRQVDLSVKYPVIVSVAAAQASGAHVGSTLDVERGAITIAVTSDAPDSFESGLRSSLREDGRTQQYADAVEVRRVSWSFESLSLQRDEVSRVLQERELLDRSTISVLTVANEIVVRLPDGISETERGEVRDELTERAPAATVSAEPAGDASPTCTRENCASEKLARGGIGIDDDSSGWSCTAGYIGRNSAADEYVITAGHCFPSPPNSMFHNGSHMANVPSGGSVDNSSVEAARGFILQGSPQNWQPTNWIYHSSSAQRFQVEARYNPTWCKANCGGIAIYKSGTTSELVTGTVGDPWMTVDGKSNYFSSSGIQCKGDSGGPVYTYPAGYAMGLATHGYDVGWTYRKGLACGSSTRSGHIVDVENAISVTVIEN